MNENPVYEIASRIVEQEDRFIFERLGSWLRESEKIEISKEELISAIKMYRNKEQFEKVVHCKECEYGNTVKLKSGDTIIHCILHDSDVAETDFCSNAKERAYDYANP